MRYTLFKGNRRKFQILGPFEEDAFFKCLLDNLGCDFLYSEMITENGQEWCKERIYLKDAIFKNKSFGVWLASHDIINSVHSTHFSKEAFFALSDRKKLDTNPMEEFLFENPEIVEWFIKNSPKEKHFRIMEALGRDISEYFDYLPRDMKLNQPQKVAELLTTEQVRNLVPYLNYKHWKEWIKYNPPHYDLVTCLQIFRENPDQIHLAKSVRFYDLITLDGWEKAIYNYSTRIVGKEMTQSKIKKVPRDYLQKMLDDCNLPFSYSVFLELYNSDYDISKYSSSIKRLDLDLQVNFKNVLDSSFYQSTIRLKIAIDELYYFHDFIKPKDATRFSRIVGMCRVFDSVTTPLKPKTVKIIYPNREETIQLEWTLENTSDEEIKEYLTMVYSSQKGNSKSCFGIETNYTFEDIRFEIL